MVNKRERRTLRGVATVCVTAIAAASPLLYLLSIGLANWLQRHGYVSGNLNSLMMDFYAPVRWLGDLFPAFGRLVLWYELLWLQ
jgi:hypothetical protein